MDDIEEFDLTDKKHVSVLKNWTKPWKLKKTGPEECFKQVYKFLKDCESEGFDYKDKLSQLKYETAKGPASFFNIAGDRYTYISHLLNEYGQYGYKEPPWEDINEILKIAEKKGVEFCSLVRGWDKNRDKGKAQGDQIFEGLLDKYKVSEIIVDPVKRNIVRILSNESLYEQPLSSIKSKNENTQYAYDEHKKLVNKPKDELIGDEFKNEHKKRQLKEIVQYICATYPNDPTKQQEYAEQYAQAILNKNKQISGDLAENQAILAKHVIPPSGAAAVKPTPPPRRVGQAISPSSSGQGRVP